MQHKIIKNLLHPPANCRICGANARVIKHATFSYFFCDSCKDECDVWLKTETYPKGVKSQYAAHEPNDIVIDVPGVYRIDYLDSPNEPFWYEHKSSHIDIRISGGLVRSSQRLTESDLPSRKPMSLAQGPNHGAKGLPPSVGTVPDETTCTVGGAVTIRKIYTGSTGGVFFAIDYAALEAQCLFNFNKDILRLPDGSLISAEQTESLQQLGGGHLGIQHGSLPPDDEV